MEYQIIKLRGRPELVPEAAHWFQHTFGVPEEAYRESMEEMLSNCSEFACELGSLFPRSGNNVVVPQWYIALDGDTVIAGMGVIENDFHDRKDLAPNVCAVYTDEPYRGQGIARALLETVCADMGLLGVDTLYLLTNHTSLYERYGWEFYCMANGGDGPARIYIHKMR